MAIYSIGYSTALDARDLARSDAERAAVDRMEGFEGTEADLRLVASLFERTGDTEYAAELLQWLPVRPRSIPCAEPDRDRDEKHRPHDGAGGDDRGEAAAGGERAQIEAVAAARAQLERLSAEDLALLLKTVAGELRARCAVRGRIPVERSTHALRAEMSREVGRLRSLRDRLEEAAAVYVEPAVIEDVDAEDGVAEIEPQERGP